jgi:hypothetical protein
MFLRAGVVPQPGWIDAAEHFMQVSGLKEGPVRAGVFRLAGAAHSVGPGFAELAGLLRAAIGGGPRPEQGLLIGRRLYDSIGGHPAGEDAEAAILRRVGRRRLTVLPAALTRTDT